MPGASSRNSKIRDERTHLLRAGTARAPLDRCAFTLTDLLVTLAVLSLLSAVVLAQGTAMRDKSRLARCTDNLRQVDRAVLSFCKDNNETLPTVTPAEQNSLWWWYKE